MAPSLPLVAIAGTAPLLLVAPHGGRRDHDAHPWGSRPLRMNDLHTAELTAELAARTGGAAVVNAATDRNVVDLNRIGAAHDRGAAFLEAVDAALTRLLERQPRVTLLTIHGWNVVQPALDVGLGGVVHPDGTVGADAAVSPAFAATAVPALVAACRARGLDATVAARYPARARENLLQLFTTRHRDDARPLVRRLVRHAARVDAVQLELGIPLRWHGRWREAFLAAIDAALPALVGASAPATPVVGDAPPGGGAGTAHRPDRTLLQFVGDDVAGLVRLDASGGNLVVFPADGTLLVFTGERVARDAPPGRVGGLVARRDAGGLQVAYDGPCLRFPDTTPFMDLERGLARAALVHARATLRLADRTAEADAFGPVVGDVHVDGAPLAVAATGFVRREEVAVPEPRLRAALRLDGDAALSMTVALGSGDAHGFVERAGHRIAIAAADADLGDARRPLARFRFRIRLADATELDLAGESVHRLPVVRGRPGAGGHGLYAACRLRDDVASAGWCELMGL